MTAFPRRFKTLYHMLCFFEAGERARIWGEGA
jgi:hypothetical protein